VFNVLCPPKDYFYYKQCKRPLEEGEVPSPPALGVRKCPGEHQRKKFLCSLSVRKSRASKVTCLTGPAISFQSRLPSPRLLGRSKLVEPFSHGGGVHPLPLACQTALLCHPYFSQSDSSCYFIFLHWWCFHDCLKFCRKNKGQCAFFLDKHKGSHTDGSVIRPFKSIKPGIKDIKEDKIHQKLLISQFAQ
jgi:hypothetical protein